MKRQTMNQAEGKRRARKKTEDVAKESTNIHDEAIEKPMRNPQCGDDEASNESMMARKRRGI